MSHGQFRVGRRRNRSSPRNRATLSAPPDTATTIRARRRSAPGQAASIASSKPGRVGLASCRAVESMDMCGEGLGDVSNIAKKCSVAVRCHCDTMLFGAGSRPALPPRPEPRALPGPALGRAVSAAFGERQDKSRPEPVIYRIVNSSIETPERHFRASSQIGPERGRLPADGLWRLKADRRAGDRAAG